MTRQISPLQWVDVTYMALLKQQGPHKEDLKGTVHPKNENAFIISHPHVHVVWDTKEDFLNNVHAALFHNHHNLF